MKKFLLFFFTICVSGSVFGQLNLTLKAHVDFPQRLNDIWGYEADGRDYALVGTATGVAIFDVTDTENPVDLGFLPGPESIWRDIKVWDTYAYVTNETGGGINVIDLSGLPNPVTPADAFRWEPVIEEIGGQLSPCHNIFIDDNGIAHLSGCNLNNGGVFFVDLATNPAAPVYVNAAPPVYSHDAYVRDDKLYSSEIFEGHLGIYDVSDLNNAQLLATQPTPFDFTHNAWLSDDGNTVFTTDEVGDAPVAAYDISDLSDIKELDQFRPLSTINQGVLPHNVFVWEDWLIISYYADGCILADATRPDNIIEVGNFDTVLPGEGGNGAWGVYPYFESGTVIVSDIEQGFFVLEPNYVRACHLEGSITDAISGAVISDARVEIASTLVNFTNSRLDGIYKTGQAIAGTFEVTYSHPAYFPTTISVTLNNGELVIQDVQLQPRPTAQFMVEVVDNETGLPVSNVNVQLEGQGLTYNIVTDGNGSFSRMVVDGAYDASFAIWGYKEKFIPLDVANGTVTRIALTPGFTDDFIFDLGWEVQSNAEGGRWELGEPIGTELEPGNFVNPEFDIDGDLGDQCYMTGNAGGSIGRDDVDNGFTQLISPPMDLSEYAEPELSFHHWFFNAFGNSTPDDVLEVRVDNGITEVTVAQFSESGNAWSELNRINLADFITMTEEVRVIFYTEDLPDSGNVLEAAIDVFKVTDKAALQAFEVLGSTAGCSPFEIEFNDPNENTTAWNWTFEGGTPATSTLRDPSVNYDASGDYMATLEVSTPEGVSTINQTINVRTFEAPAATITSTLLSNGQVVFTSETTDAVSYFWDFGDGTSSTIPNPSHTYLEEGTYTAVLTVTNPCGAVSDTEIISIFPVSTTDLTANLDSWKIFPNPTTDVFNVSVNYTSEFQTANLFVYNLMGQLVETATVNNAGVTQVGSKLSSGMYLIVLEIDGQRVVVEKGMK